MFITIFGIFIFFLRCKTPIKKEYTITPSVVNFSINRDTSFETIFYVKNNGLDNLIISEIATECGCVVGTLLDSIVFPNDSIALKVKYTPKPTDSGEIFRFISIRTNGIPPIKSVSMRGNVN